MGEPFRPTRKLKPLVWSRRGRCSSCKVGTGSRHGKHCTFSYGPLPTADGQSEAGQKAGKISAKERFIELLWSLAAVVIAFCTIMGVVYLITHKCFN